MNYSELADKLNDLLSLPAETEVVEFKEAKTSFDIEKLGRYFSALSNEANLRSMLEKPSASKRTPALHKPAHP